MQTYLLSLLGGSLAVALIGILAPNGASKHIKLISSLFLVCILVAPLPKAIGSIRSWMDDLNQEIDSGSDSSDYATQMEEAIESASKTYFAQSLTQMLEQRFSITPGEIRCSIQWAEGDEQMQPLRITLILSGSAIWKNPADMEEFVTELLGCECVTAIE